MNIQVAEKIIKELVNFGIRSFCLCPGGRLAPFVEGLSHSKGLEILSFFEERSACFFALGRAERDKKPVAVLTTSGTAVAELVSAVIEAYYSACPLVLITADRPLELGKKAAPQTLKNAVRLLEDYCHVSKNIVKPSDIDLSKWNPCKGHLHLNVCFDEPLLDEELSVLDFSSFKEKNIPVYPYNKFSPTVNETYTKSCAVKEEKSTSNENLRNRPIWSENFSSYRREKTEKLKPDRYISNEEIKEFFQICNKPLLLVGELKTEEKPVVKELLNHYSGIFYTEPLSGLEDRDQRLVSGELILKYALDKQEIDGVIRLGGIPRVRFWRDLEKQNLPVLNVSSPPFYAGLARPSFNCPLLKGVELLRPYFLSLGQFGESLKTFDQIQLKKGKDILKSHPESEDNWFLVLKETMRDNTNLFLGNSSPIRLWDKLAFCKKRNLHIRGQSGVNGIDGLVSRFLGGCDFRMNNVGILGDLTVLYDMAGFWNAKSLPPWTLFVINNFGGRIFSRMFENPAFLNQHKLSFSSLAEMWGLNYSLYESSSGFSWPETGYNLVEIRPKEEDTRACFVKSVSIWDSL